MQSKKFVIMLLLLMVLSSCGQGPTEVPPGVTNTPAATDTPAPTATASPIPPTFTPEPTFTPTLVPTPALSFEVPTPKEGKGTIVVSVLNNKMQPEANISVLLSAEDQPIKDAISRYTDSAGYAVFKNVEPGKYWILVHLQTIRWYEQYLVSDAYYVEAGQTLNAYPLYTYEYDLKATSPAKNEGVTSLPTLKWNEYPGAAYYELNIALSSRSVNFPSKSIRVEGTEYTFEQPLVKCGYDWGVAAFDEEGHKIGSTPIGVTVSELRHSMGMSMHFFVENSDFSCDINLISPEYHAEVIGTDGVEFSWEPHPLAACYRIFLKSDEGEYISDDDITPYQIDGAHTSYKVDTIAKGVYTWRVDACNSTGETIATSGSIQFFVK
jgi:predicted small lipoprotein YifL